MLARDLPSVPKTLDVVPQSIPLVLAEGGGRALALILPPLDDLAEINDLRSRLYSVQENVDLRTLKELFKSELEDLRRVEKRFSKSPTYFNRIANLAFVAGDFEEEARNLQRAKDLSEDIFFLHEIGENLVSRQQNKAAEALYRSLNLQNDLQANLRLAFFHVQRNEIEQAVGFVDQALRIDPLDFGARLFEGGLLLARGEYQRAIQSFRVAEESRQTATLYTNMAIAYVRLGLAEKSLAALKKAVSLDPLHVNANVFLADLAFRERRNEEALPSLRQFVQHEQTNSEVWSRLARASFHVGLIEDTIAALKREASLGESGVIWNNLGVCYLSQKKQKKALQAFRQALLLDEGVRNQNYFLAARNLVQTLMSSGTAAVDILEITSELIDEDKDSVCIQSDVSSDIYALHIAVLIRLSRFEEARESSEGWLASTNIATRLKAWLASNLISYDTMYSNGDRALQLIAEYERVFSDRRELQDNERRAMFFNNAAFAYAERGELIAAESYLSMISDQIHRWPYPTATLGLIHFRKGHLQRAMELYREAVGLCRTDTDKGRIRQKLHLERGRYFLEEGQYREAQRSLQRVIHEKQGERALKEGASRLLQLIDSRSSA